MSIEHNPQWTNKRDAIVVTLCDVAPGETITYDEMAARHKVSGRHGDGHDLVYNARERCRTKHGITFRVVNGVGFQRLKDGDVVNDNSRARRVRGQARRMIGEYKGVNTSALSDAERDTLARKMVEANLLAAVVKAPTRSLPHAGDPSGEALRRAIRGE